MATVEASEYPSILRDLPSTASKIWSSVSLDGQRECRGLPGQKAKHELCPFSAWLARLDGLRY